MKTKSIISVNSSVILRVGILSKLCSICLSLLVLCLSIACISSNNAIGVIKNAPEVKMIGKTFEEVENEYGPFSMVYFDNGKASYIFEKTSISFYFDDMDAVSLWKEELNTASIPAAIALKSIKSTDVCTGVTGRVKDFGLTDPKLLENRISTEDIAKSDNDESCFLIPIDGTPLMLVIYSENTGEIEAGSRLLVTDAAFTPIKKEIEQGSSSPVAAATPSVKNVRIIDVEAGDYHTVGLREDGTVVAVGDNSSGQCEVDTWTNVIKISAGRGHTVGLRADGSIYDTRPANSSMLEWKNAIDIAAGDYLTIVLFDDGTVKVASTSDNYFGECNVDEWTDIVDIAAGNSHVVGLRSDGTVVATGLNGGGQCDVSEWANIVSIDASGWHTVGIKSDGTVVFTGDSFLFRAKEDDSNEYTTTQGWSNVMFISCGSANTVALCTDGTVLSTIVDDATAWENITDICTGASRETDWTRYHTVGLKADGTLVAIGNNEFGQCNVIDWSIIEPSSMKSTEAQTAEPMNTPTPKAEIPTTKPQTAPSTTKPPTAPPTTKPPTAPPTTKPPTAPPTAEPTWSEWSTNQPPSDALAVESKTQYRYRDKSTTTSESSSLSGWTLESGPETVYGEWSPWSDSSISGSSTLQVEKRTVYRLYYYACSKCGYHMPWYDEGSGGHPCYNCGKHSTPKNSHKTLWQTTPYNKLGSSSSPGNKRKVTIDGCLWYFNSADLNGTPSSSNYIKDQWRSRSISYVYTFYKWSDWSSWSDSAVSSSSTRQVETRTLYRYKK